MGQYEAKDKIATGDGRKDDGEEIEVLEMALPEAMAKVDSREIMDAKTIMLVQYAALHRLVGTEAT